jgi:hypothetical protein
MNRSSTKLLLALSLWASGSILAFATSPVVTLVAGWDFDTTTQSSTPLATAIQSVRQYNANFGSNNGTVPRMILDGTLGSSRWNTSSGEIWTANGTQTNLLPGSSLTGNNTALLLRSGSGLSAEGKQIVFQLNMTKSRRLEISYAAQATAGGFTTHEWHYWDDIVAKDWLPITDAADNAKIPIPTSLTTIVLDQVGGAGFNNRPNVRVRLTVSGATSASGTNILDNIRFNAIVAP